MNCRRELLNRLAATKAWMGREALTHGLDASEWIVDNVLADLVTEGAVMFNTRGAQYRLAGEPLAREALRELLAKPGLKRFAVGRQSTQNPRLYRLGVAQRQVGDEAAICYEIELEYPGLDGMLRLQAGLREWMAP
jgi:hypothetical protein